MQCSVVSMINALLLPVCCLFIGIGNGPPRICLSHKFKLVNFPYSFNRWMTVSSQIRTSRVGDPSGSDTGYLKWQWINISLQKPKLCSQYLWHWTRILHIPGCWLARRLLKYSSRNAFKRNVFLYLIIVVRVDSMPLQFLILTFKTWGLLHLWEEVHLWKKLISQSWLKKFSLKCLELPVPWLNVIVSVNKVLRSWYN